MQLRDRLACLPVLGLAVVVLVVACGGGTGAPPSPVPTGTVQGTVGVTTAAIRRPGAFRVHRPVPRLATARAYVPGEVLVRFRPGVSLAEASGLHARVGTTPVRRLHRDVVVARITSGESVESVVARYRAHPAVLYAEPNFYRSLAAVPNDPFYASQWHYGSAGFPRAWDLETGDPGIVVAVIDSGIIPHPELTGAIAPGWDTVDDDPDPTDPGCPTASDPSHGTHVAGTIRADSNNGTGVAGTNWSGTLIMPIRAFSNVDGACVATTADIVEAIDFARTSPQDVDVINMSFTSNTFSQAEQDALTAAAGDGILLVAAAGNENASTPTYPACYAGVIAVSATRITNTRASYSNTGPCIDLAAPGGEFLGTDLNCDGFEDGILSTSGTLADPAQYWFFTGTSMAAPHVSGLAALLLAAGVAPGLVLSRMQSTAIDLGPPGPDTTFGAGLINAGAALTTAPAEAAMRVFTGDLSGTTLTVRSDMVLAPGNGAFLVTNAHTGTRSLFAWRDVNGNGVIDGGDLFGSTPVTVAENTATCGVTVNASPVPPDSPPITLAGSTAARR